MRLRTLHKRNLAFHRRMNLAVGLGVMAATAALTGALLVGDSMRASLRDLALARLAGTDHALRSTRFFDRSLANRIATAPEFAEGFQTAIPVTILRASCDNAQSGARVGHANLIGADATLDERFAGEFGSLLNEPLARELGASVGDDVILRVGKVGTVSTETLLGRRDDTVTSIRRTVQGIIPATGAGALDLNPRHQTPRNAFVPLESLQRLLRQDDRVNTILVAADEGADTSTDTDRLQEMLQGRWRPDDVGLRIRVAENHGYVSIESDRFLIEPPAERAVRAINAVDLENIVHVHDPVGSVLTYLANEIAIEGDDQGAAIPYSTVAALDTAAMDSAKLPLAGGGFCAAIDSGDLILNEWAASDLRVKPGDRLALTFLVTGRFGALKTRQASFRLRDVVQLAGGADDPGFTPEYAGVTDTDSIADWDPPFPVDLSKVREKDEAYWDDHQTTPKAFISLDDGTRLWGEDADRFGQLTSMRVYPTHDANVQTVAAAMERALHKHLQIAELGFRFDPVRERAIAAGRGSTDFGGLFIGFSLFLIVAAAMLVALLFRLGVEHRSGEIGLLLAMGFSPGHVTRILVVDGTMVAGVGAALGLLASIGYAWSMLAGLRSWWSDAVNAPFLTLHVSATSLVIGYSCSVAVALFAIRWSIRGLTRSSPRSLMAGTVKAGRAVTAARRKRSPRFVAFTSAGLSLALGGAPMVGDAIPETLAFFGSGACMLVAILAGLNHWLRLEQRGAVHRSCRTAMIRLGLRNAPRHAGRSLLTIGLIASATFVISALQAFRIDVDPSSLDRRSGTGGFTLAATAPVPLQYDLNTVQGREALNASAIPPETRVWPFRLRDGDESSCLNLYLPTNPRIVGATRAMIERGGFAFGATMAESDTERDNPWTLLDRTFPDGAIPAIGDEAAVKWQHHLGIGQDLVVTDERNREVRLRFVALLNGSALQDELIVAESRFEEIFPSIGGYGFFLIETQPSGAATTAAALERELRPFGFDAISTADRLTEYLAVQNTYLSTFQTLGGLGLVLGTIGLAAVLLRNVSERRSELALMRTVGFSFAALRWMVLAENVALVLAGLAAGFVPAMVAVIPHLARAPRTLPWMSMGATLMAVLAVGTLSGVVALASALRSPLLPALRAE